MVGYAVFSMTIAVAIKLGNRSQAVQSKYLIVIVASFALFTLTKVYPALIITGADLYGKLTKWISSTQGKRQI